MLYLALSGVKGFNSATLDHTKNSNLCNELVPGFAMGES